MALKFPVSFCTNACYAFYCGPQWRAAPDTGLRDLAPNMSFNPPPPPHRETYWSRIRRCTVRNFQISIVKTCKHCPQTASTSGGLRPPDSYRTPLGTSLPQISWAIALAGLASPTGNYRRRQCPWSYNKTPWVGLLVFDVAGTGTHVSSPPQWTSTS